MKKKVVLCSAALLAANYQSANAMDFGDKFYGKAQIGVGYDNQFYQGDLKKFAKDNDRGEDIRSNTVNGNIFLNVGYNVYYRLNDTFNPFVGLNTYARFPVFGGKLLSKNGENNVKNVSANEYFGFNAKLGTRVNFVKNFALEPYALLGLNLVKAKYKWEYFRGSETTSKSRAGLITGVGADAVFADRFVVGLEYRYSVAKFSEGLSFEDNFYKVPSFKFKTHTVAFKLGVQF